ncbi:hypothetical protein [Streptomyces rhizosphaerihabitans]|uniref:hypothetical protein n=1 Tax=Streptomyces rhizosphaerihabitans TaxID=1266770 RepID=UPI0021BEFB80|nr:hypothetical protein [Streptomyces rhizosphaerihabitans]MCT9010797.1 hypothetical protein [Streptomyces rhizosphaerihabitans]
MSTMSEIEAVSVSREAADYFITAANYIAEDAAIRRLRYHLLRLGASAGLTDKDVEELGELGSLVFREDRTTDQTAKIANRADASPLAVTIAKVVEEGTSSARWPTDPKAVLLGAVLGAYISLSALSDTSGPSPEVSATSGAVAGALAASASTFVMGNIERTPLDDYLDMREG